MNSSPLLIENGRCLDPGTGKEDVRDLYVEDGRIAVRPDPLPDAVERIDAAGLWLVPGFVDVHVHLREPGGTEAETIATGAAAALNGGITALVAMPNTQPPIDTPERVQWVLQHGRQAGRAAVWTTACLTIGRAGRAVAPLAELADAGAVAFTDDGCTVQDDAVMRAAMAQAAALGIPVMDHAQDRTMEANGGCMHEGARSRAWGLPGIPAEAEIRIVERDIRLAEETGCTLHIQHVTCGISVERIAAAQQRGVRVTAEATPHHLWFCDEDIDPDQPDRFKMNPPLRTAADRDALLEGVAAGVLSILATDHAPHTLEAKRRGFQSAPFGVVGLETAIGATYTCLVRSGRVTLLDWVRAWTVHPLALLNKPAPGLRPGESADLIVLDTDRVWAVDAQTFQSLSRNTPFNGVRLYGYPVEVIAGGLRRPRSGFPIVGT